jgi:hypothetical protein
LTKYRAGSWRYAVWCSDRTPEELLSRTLSRRPENPRRKHMVFAALIVETGIAVVVAGALAAWSRKRFAPRNDAG